MEKENALRMGMDSFVVVIESGLMIGQTDDGESGDEVRR